MNRGMGLQGPQADRSSLLRILDQEVAKSDLETLGTIDCPALVAAHFYLCSEADVQLTSDSLPVTLAWRQGH